jgi:hypothetical protein
MRLRFTACLSLCFVTKFLENHLQEKGFVVYGQLVKNEGTTTTITTTKTTTETKGQLEDMCM